MIIRGIKDVIVEICRRSDTYINIAPKIYVVVVVEIAIRNTMVLATMIYLIAVYNRICRHVFNGNNMDPKIVQNASKD